MKLQLTFLFCLATMVGISKDTLFYDISMREVPSLADAHFYSITKLDTSDQTIVVKRFYYKSGQIKSEKRYSLYNKTILVGRNSEWFENGNLSKTIDYKDGKYHGEFNTYWENGQQRRQDLYEDGELKNGICWNIEGDEINYIPYEVKPAFPGGEDMIYRHIYYNLKYPEKARESRTEGDVIIKFLIDTSGKVVKERFLTSLNEYLDAEALRVIRSLPNWQPGLIEGEKAEFEYTLTINFKISTTSYDEDYNVVDTIYYDSIYRKILSRDEAVYYSVDNIDIHDRLRRYIRFYYKSGKLKSERKYHLYDRRRTEGKMREWYESGQLQAEISYVAGKIHGKLITYWESGQKRREDNYKRNKFISGKCWDSNGKEINHCLYEDFPDLKIMVDSIESLIKYPADALESNGEDVVLIHFSIKKDGQIEGLAIYRGINELFDKEALRAANLIKNWKPAYKECEPIEVYVILPIKFKLN